MLTNVNLKVSLAKMYFSKSPLMSIYKFFVDRRTYYYVKYPEYSCFYINNVVILCNIDILSQVIPKTQSVSENR